MYGCLQNNIWILSSLLNNFHLLIDKTTDPLILTLKLMPGPGTEQIINKQLAFLKIINQVINEHE